MATRRYDGTRRAAASSQTRARILAAARDLLTGSPLGMPSVGAVAGRAGLSRLSVYHHFGSHGGLLGALAASAPAAHEPASGSAAEQLRARIRASCERWATDPTLFRRLPAATEAADPPPERMLAQRLAEEDQLRAGCSLKEAEDVVALVCSFAAFDRLHQGGRRSTSAVAEILTRMAGAVLSSSA